MGLLSKKQLLEKGVIEVVKVDLGNENFVFVRQMSGRERDHFEQSLLKMTKDSKGKIDGYEQNLEDFRAKLAVATICDEKGELLLTFNDFPVLSQNMGYTMLDKIIAAAQELNKITEEDKEVLLKNSEAVQDGNSNSDSVKN